jgi:hypothetical protein
MKRGSRMRKVVIEIECEDDCFEPHPAQELANVLAALSDHLLYTGTATEIPKNLLSSDGHTVGLFRLVNWHR